MKKVLIITYYWIPSGGAGVQRWIKFVKYLREFGWEPIIYTPENPDFSIEDISLQKDVPVGIQVIKRPIWEPYGIFKMLIGKKGQKVNVSFADNNKKNNVIHKLAFSIRGNLLIPDPRCFWIRPSFRFLNKYLKNHPVDVIVSTGPPHSMHMIGMKVHKSTKIPWIADFRDPWTNIDFYKDLNLTFFANKIHHYHEKKVLTNASRVVSVSPTWCKELANNAQRSVDLVHNGYDEEDVIHTDKPMDSDFSITHIGSINKDRNPKVLWVALKSLLEENEGLKQEIKIKLVGNIDPIIFSDIEQYGLTDFVEIVGYLPHNEAVVFQQTSQVLLLLINNTPNANGILTGKLYEYIASTRPILSIGLPRSDSAKLLRETQAGVVIDFEDVEGMKASILDLYEKYKEGTLQVKAIDYEKYSRKNQCEAMVKILNEVIK